MNSLFFSKPKLYLFSQKKIFLKISNILFITSPKLIFSTKKKKRFMKYQKVTNVLNFLIRTSTEVEALMVSAERINEYTHLTTEAPEVIEDNRPSEEWPQKGEIKFEKVSLRYRAGLDLVLKEVDFHVAPQEKVGVVGRTGAGGCIQ